MYRLWDLLKFANIHKPLNAMIIMDLSVHVYEVFIQLILIGKSSCIIWLKYVAYLKYVDRGQSCRLMFMQENYGPNYLCFFITHTFVVKHILTCIYLLFILSRESVFHRVVLQREALHGMFYLLHIRSDLEREDSRRKGS